MSENNQHRIPNWMIYIAAIILIVIVIVVGMNFIAPSIGNVYPDPLQDYSLDWNCVEQNGCSGCWELNWDTGWCSDCINICSR